LGKTRLRLRAKNADKVPQKIRNTELKIEHETSIAAKLQSGFRERYGTKARVFRAPGRVNLIGEHTDYNDGFVMPAAIDLGVWIAIAPRDDRTLLVHSENFSESAEIKLDEQDPRPRGHWSDYVQGMAVVLRNAGYRVRGGNMLVCGQVPIGSGLSSSAAIEVVAGLALIENSGLPVNRFELTKLCRRAENEFVGAHVGIMDPFISCNGQAGHALLLDCRSLECRLLPIPADVSLVICNTMVKHELASGEYNTRRVECEEGVQRLSRRLPHVHALRDVGIEDLDHYRSDLPETIYKRCRHVVTENTRVRAAAAALEKEDLATFGRLMAESHISLKNDYEVSCLELDLMVELAGQVGGVFGARMTGGGFGGSTVNLVDRRCVENFQISVSSAYKKSTGLDPQILVSSAAAGAAEVMASTAADDFISSNSDSR
jgi:galactokinase